MRKTAAKIAYLSKISTPSTFAASKPNSFCHDGLREIHGEIAVGLLDDEKSKELCSSGELAVELGIGHDSAIGLDGGFIQELKSAGFKFSYQRKSNADLNDESCEANEFHETSLRV